MTQYIDNQRTVASVIRYAIDVQCAMLSQMGLTRKYHNQELLELTVNAIERILDGHRVQDAAEQIVQETQQTLKSVGSEPLPTHTQHALQAVLELVVFLTDPTDTITIQQALQDVMEDLRESI